MYAITKAWSPPVLTWPQPDSEILTWFDQSGFALRNGSISSEDFRRTYQSCTIQAAWMGPPTFSTHVQECCSFQSTEVAQLLTGGDISNLGRPKLQVHCTYRPYARPGLWPPRSSWSSKHHLNNELSGGQWRRCKGESGCRFGHQIFLFLFLHRT